MRMHLGVTATGSASLVTASPAGSRILKEIGFERPPTQRKDEFTDEVTFEQILQMDGDLFFYMTFET